jgi:hypothetical protein
MEVEQEKQKAKEQLKHFDKTRFFKFNKDLLKEKINVIVDVSQEELDKNTMIQNLTSLLAQYNPLAGGRLDVDAIIVEVLDLLGLSGRRFYKKEENILLSQQFALSGMPGQPLAAGQPQPQRQAVMTAQGQKLPQ